RCALAPLRIPAEDRDHYQSWVHSGFAGPMAYLSEEPSRRWEMGRTLPGFSTVLSLGVSYFSGNFPEKPGAGYGRVARYAWGRDYHEVIRTRLDHLVNRLRSEAGIDVASVSAVDSKPVLERVLAREAGTGFIGKN